MKLKSNNGFTLIELMIVLAAFIIITLFAVAQYSSRIKKAKIIFAEATLKEMANAIEKIRLKGLNYTDNSIKEAYEAFLTNDNGIDVITYSDDKTPIYRVDFVANSSATGYDLFITAEGDWIDKGDENAVMCINHLLSFNRGSELCDIHKLDTDPEGGAGSGS